MQFPSTLPLPKEKEAVDEHPFLFSTKADGPIEFLTAADGHTLVNQNAFRKK